MVQFLEMPFPLSVFTVQMVLFYLSIKLWLHFYSSCHYFFFGWYKMMQEQWKEHDKICLLILSFLLKHVYSFHFPRLLVFNAFHGIHYLTILHVQMILSIPFWFNKNLICLEPCHSEELSIVVQFTGSPQRSQECSWGCETLWTSSWCATQPHKALHTVKGKEIWEG